MKEDEDVKAAEGVKEEAKEEAGDVHGDDEGLQGENDDIQEDLRLLHGERTSLVLAIRSAVGSDDFLEAERLRPKLRSLHDQLMKHSLCDVCYIPMPSTRARKFIPELKKCYGTQQAPRFAVCGQGAMAHSLWSDERQEAVEQSLRQRVYYDLQLVHHLLDDLPPAAQPTRKDSESLSRHIRNLATKRGGHGRGLRFAKRQLLKPDDVEARDWPFLRALAAQGEVSRTLDRIASEDNLVLCNEPLKLALKLLLAR